MSHDVVGLRSPASSISARVPNRRGSMQILSRGASRAGGRFGTERGKTRRHLTIHDSSCSGNVEGAQQAESDVQRAPAHHESTCFVSKYAVIPMARTDRADDIQGVAEPALASYRFNGKASQCEPDSPRHERAANPEFAGRRTRILLHLNTLKLTLLASGASHVEPSCLH